MNGFVGPLSSVPGVDRALVRANELTHRTWWLPLLIFYPTGRCNSRCLSCDWWRSRGEGELGADEVDALASALPPLGTRRVVFSGGEPLVRTDVFEVARSFRRYGLALELLTSGLSLGRYAADVSQTFERVTISLDAADAESYRAIRGVDALDALESGVRELRTRAPEIPVLARTTIHRMNFREMPRVVEKARSMGLDGVSFLAADLSSTAFGRVEAPRSDDAALRLEPSEIDELERVIEHVIERFENELRSGFIAESPAKLRRLVGYYRAAVGLGPFPAVSCNAPWISAVVEANGGVRPCFFHEPIGNLRTTPFSRILRESLPAFRRTLDVSTNPVCMRCVCTLRSARGDAA